MRARERRRSECAHDGRHGAHTRARAFGVLYGLPPTSTKTARGRHAAASATSLEVCSRNVHLLEANGAAAAAAPRRGGRERARRHVDREDGRAAIDEQLRRHAKRASDLEPAIAIGHLRARERAEGVRLTAQHERPAAAAAAAATEHRHQITGACMRVPAAVELNARLLAGRGERAHDTAAAAAHVHAAGRAVAPRVVYDRREPRLQHCRRRALPRPACRRRCEGGSV